MGVPEFLGDVGNTILGKNKYRAKAPDFAVNQEDQQRQLEVRGQQQGYNQWLQNAMAGKGPSVAEQQMHAGQQAAIRSAASQAASARGGNVALATRAQGTQLATGMQQANRDAAQLRAAEQMAYAQQYGNQLNQQRLADLQARGYSIDEAKAIVDSQLRTQEINAKITEGNAERGQGGVGTLIAGAGALAGAFSDILSKEDIKPAFSIDQLQSQREQYQREQEAERMRRAQAQPNTGQKVGGILSMMGGMLSDKQSKEKIRTLESQKQSLADALKLRLQPAVPAESAQLPQYQTTPQQDVAAELARQQAMGQMRGGGAYQLYARPAPGGAQYDVMTEQEAQPQSTGFQPVMPPNATSSDFAAKESVRDLAPIRPVNYRYRPDTSLRMAMEQGGSLPEQEMIYRDKRAPRNGIIAQDLEKSPAFEDSVIDTPAGKKVLQDRALSEALAQMAGLDKRLSAVEAMKGKKRGARSR